MKMKYDVKGFKRMRTASARISAEDITRIIYTLIEKEGSARLTRVSRSMGVSHVTALRTMRRLEKRGYLVTSKRRPVVLTKKGKKLALATIERRQLLLRFFGQKLPLITAEIIERDLEGFEHFVGKELLDYIGRSTKQNMNR
jgi:DtxR family manganese transport transcriptional regulator